jgi:hypothetical protein
MSQHFAISHAPYSVACSSHVTICGTPLGDQNGLLRRGSEPRVTQLRSAAQLHHVHQVRLLLATPHYPVC